MMIMKKIFNSLFVIIASMVAFAGCQKEENNAPAAQTKTVEFFANSIETKTVFGESYTEGTDTKYPTLWTAGDKVKVYLNLSIPSGTSGTEKSQIVELLEGTETSASAKFKAEIVDYSPESYTFYAVSPSDAANARTSSRVTVVIPTLQKPLATSPAKDAQIVYAISETTEEMPSSIDMDFRHFTAYGKLSFSNLASTSVSKVKIVAPADVCLSGKWNYLPADGTLAPHSEGTSNEITIETTSTSDIWFACGPVDVSGKTLKFIVTTDDGNLEKEITFPANRKFQSGKVAKFTVDMDGVTVPEPEESTVTLTKVTDVSQFTAGTYIIVSEDEKYYLPNVATSSAPSAKSVTKVNGVIQLSDDMLWDTKSSGNGLIFESSAVSGRYLVATKADNNAIQVNTTSDVVWTASTVSGHGVVMLSSKATDRYLSMYKTQDWRYYKSSNIPGSTSNQYANLYKVQDADTPGQPDAPATPVLSVTATEVNVDAAAGNGEIAYSVENSVSGTTVSASTTATWITNFSYTTAGKVTFSVSANTGEERSAVVTLTYPGAAESKNVTVKQAAGQGGSQPTGGYVLITNVADITTGQYVIAAKVNNKYYAMNNTSFGSSKINGAEVAVSNNTIAKSAATLYVVTITKSSSSYTIQSGGNYLTYAGSGTNLGSARSPYNWTIAEGTNGTFRFTSATSSRGLVFRAGTNNQFGGYALSNVKANGTEYYDVELFKLN